AVRLERVAHGPPMVGQRARPRVAELLHEACRALDVREQVGDAHRTSLRRQRSNAVRAAPESSAFAMKPRALLRPTSGPKPAQSRLETRTTAGPRPFPVSRRAT